MNIYTHASHSSSASQKRRSSFARDMARDAFGRLGHLHDDQWANFTDTTPDQLFEKRHRATWGGR